MRFSVIMPSYLGPYKNAATDRENKFKRAIESVIAQSFDDWELIIVSDGCDRTVELATSYLHKYSPKIRILQLRKQPLWSGTVRNAGILRAKGDIITYVDIDDKIGEDHLKKINEGFSLQNVNAKGSSWVYYDDYYWSAKEHKFKLHLSSLTPGRCGTSNFSHKRSLNVYWMSNTYMHDFVMIRMLMEQCSEFQRIDTPEYYVCHVPNHFDV